MSIHFHHRAICGLSVLSGVVLAAAWGQTQPSYTVTTIAGNNTSGYTGDAGAATAAELSVPVCVIMDSKGNLYISDQANYRVRYVTGSTGIITTAAGDGVAGYYGDKGNSGVTGLASDAELSTPSGLVLDSGGNLYIADTTNNVIRKVTPDGYITTVAGVNGYSGNTWAGDGASATLANLYHPSSLLYDSSGNLYIADTSNNAIRKVRSSDGVIVTIAGTTTRGYDGNNGPAVKATLNNPVAIALDASGNLYIADSGNNVIRRVDAISGVITTVAGNGAAGYSGDGGSATSGAQLNNPKGIIVDSGGNLYISDTNNNVIRFVSTTGIISTIAGTGHSGYSGDGGAALSAQLNFPSNISMDASGNIYVADTNNNVIRKLTVVTAASTVKLPTITAKGIVTAGNFGGSTTVAPGSWVEIYGANLAPDTRSWATSDFSNSGQNAPVSLDRTSVMVANQQAFVDYISPAQVNVLLPQITTGTQSLTISTAAGTSAAYSLNVSTSAFALYAPSQIKITGTQYVGAILSDGATFVLPSSAKVSGIASRPAHAGEIITLYGVGFGAVTNGTLPGTAAPNPSTLTGTVQVLFNGTPAVIQYQGLAPGSFGLYQFNVVVPTIPASDLVPVVITLNGTQGAQTLYTAIQ